MALRMPVTTQRFVVLNSASPPSWVHGSGGVDAPQSVTNTIASFANLTLTETTDLGQAPALPIVVPGRPAGTTRASDSRYSRHPCKQKCKAFTQKRSKLCNVDGCRIPRRGPIGYRFCAFHGCDKASLMLLLEVQNGDVCPNRRVGLALQCAEHLSDGALDAEQPKSVSEHLLDVVFNTEELLHCANVANQGVAPGAGPLLRRVETSPLPAGNLQYEVPRPPTPPPRNASYHGFTEAGRPRQVPPSPDSHCSRFTCAEETAQRLHVLEEDYRRKQVDKFLLEQAGFECKQRCGKQVIIRGGFKEFEARAIMQQPVSPIKLLLLQAGRDVTRGRMAWMHIDFSNRLAKGICGYDRNWTRMDNC